MTKKKCPKCEQILPVACKSCSCGHIFIAKKYSTSKQSDGNSKNIEVPANLRTDDATGLSAAENISVAMESQSAKPKCRSSVANNDEVLEVCNHYTACASRTLMADIEGMKLDIVILESRLPPAILQNESDINLLRIGRKDMETVVRQQQETISKLNEESQFLRSKFKVIESLLSKLTDNNHESDVNDYSPAAYVCNISGVASPHEGEQLVNPLNSNLHANSVTSNNNDLLPSIADEPVYFNLNDINPKTKTTEVSAFKQRPLRDMSQCNSTVNNIELKRKPIVDSRNHHRSDNKHRNKSSELVELDKSSQEPNDMNNNCHSTTGLNVKDGNTSPVIEVTVPDQPDRPNTGKYSNFDHMPPKHKSTVPCPFLLHRGRCIKGIKCDFSHSNLERKSKEQQRFSKPKHLTPCPFLERKGNCLKGSRCYFFHKSNHFQQRHHLKQYENLPFLEPLQSIKLLLEHVELGLQRFNVAGTRF